MLLLLVVGGGFVGTVTSVVFSELGHRVHLVEADPVRRASLAEGRPPFEEPGVAEAMQAQQKAGRLKVIAPEELAGVDEEQGPNGPDRYDAAFLCVGTPPAADGSADLTQVQHAVAAVAPHVDILCVKSTVPPGTIENVVAPIAARVPLPPRLAMVPEFLAEGQALHDARAPARIVIGTHDDDAAATLESLHVPLGGTILRTTPRGAEMAKYASNAMLAARVGIVNEIANLCHRMGAPLGDVMQTVGSDPRIGPRFLDAGLGFGGSCFPKDVLALSTLGRREGSPMPILDEVLRQNEQQPKRIVDILEGVLEGLEGKRVAVLGLAFKPDTSDARESRAVAVAEELARRGAVVSAHDPEAHVQCRGVRQVDDVRHALEGADACVLATPWEVYLRLDWEHLAATMQRPLILDPWRRLGPVAGARLISFGEPHNESSHTRSRAWDEVPALHEERA